VKVLIVEHTSTGTALASSQVLPIVWAAVLCAWTVAYGNYRWKQGERAAAAAGPAGRRKRRRASTRSSGPYTAGADGSPRPKAGVS
jgi:hypothetical protein